MTSVFCRVLPIQRFSIIFDDGNRMHISATSVADKQLHKKKLEITERCYTVLLLLRYTTHSNFVVGNIKTIWNHGPIEWLWKQKVFTATCQTDYYYLLGFDLGEEYFKIMIGGFDHDKWKIVYVYNKKEEEEEKNNEEKRSWGGWELVIEKKWS
ncbi:hypothetical protein BDA99DRAFT_541442 [Phascolomyces articulosus]|uniref:Uncharacterized protein n=1 Tax=Phascolomyces articulosus TaxID=60185 RepID=A0AAD5K2Q5_9FUNG|nr:hypothetical protein BDA99DRAFT_541442 [Phascolomyces articulosus]